MATKATPVQDDSRNSRNSRTQVPAALHPDLRDACRQECRALRELLKAIHEGAETALAQLAESKKFDRDQLEAMTVLMQDFPVQLAKVALLADLLTGEVRR